MLTITKITALNGDYLQIDFVLTDPMHICLLLKSGIIQLTLCKQTIEYPVMIFNAAQKQGSLFAQKSTFPFAESDWLNQSLVVDIPRSTIEPPTKKPVLIIGKNQGIASAVFWAQQWRNLKPLVFLESNSGFPFTPQPSRILITALPSNVIACAPLLEDWQIPSRLCSAQDLPGCFQGSALELVDYYTSHTASYPFIYSF